MRIKPTIGSVVGETNVNHWGQVFLTPGAYGVVEVVDSEGAARAVGVGLLGKLTRRLSSPPVSLSAVWEICCDLKESRLATLILLVPVGSVVYLGVVGQGTVYLKRQDQLARLLTDEGCVSGELKEGDTLLLGSAAFTRAFSHEELAHVFDHLPAPESAEKLTLMFHDKDNGRGGAALVFQVASLLPLETQDSKVVVDAMKPGEARRRRIPRIAFPRVPRFHLRKVLARLSFWVVGARGLRFSGAVALIALFAVSMIVGVVKQRRSAVSAVVTKGIQDAQASFDEGMALLDINPVKGRERLTQAKDLLVPLVSSISPRSKEGRMLATLYRTIEENLTAAMHVVEAEPQLFFDAALLKKGGNISAMALWDETVALADSSTKTVYQVIASSKNGEVVGGGEHFKTSRGISLQGDNVYVLHEGGISRTSVATKKTDATIVKKSPEWGSVTTLVSFGGNLYLLDMEKSRVWKYVVGDKSMPAQAGFSELREYLNPDTLPDLTAATGMAIDGSVWVGTADGKILRFTQGRENTFVPKGVEPGFGKRLLVYTSDEANNVYVLDADNKRVVVLDKEGEYVAQYTWKGNISPSQLVVSEKLKIILLLADGKIYSIGLR